VTSSLISVQRISYEGRWTTGHLRPSGGFW
jgi:hypothetical protein